MLFIPMLLIPMLFITMLLIPMLLIPMNPYGISMALEVILIRRSIYNQMVVIHEGQSLWAAELLSSLPGCQEGWLWLWRLEEPFVMNHHQPLLITLDNVSFIFSLKSFVINHWNWNPERSWSISWTCVYTFLHASTSKRQFANPVSTTIMVDNRH